MCTVREITVFVTQGIFTLRISDMGLTKKKKKKIYRLEAGFKLLFDDIYFLNIFNIVMLPLMAPISHSPPFFCLVNYHTRSPFISMLLCI